jgi:hypothetical protein
MNKTLWFELLLDRVSETHEEFDRELGFIGDRLYELQSRRSDAVTRLPWERPPRDPGDAVPLLRAHFSDRVTLISFVLAATYPSRFLFYRTGDLEDAIFDGCSFFSDVVPQLAFDFSRVGRNGFDRYLIVNRQMHDLAAVLWPDIERPQSRVLALLYDQLALLFTTPNDYNRYWLAAGRMENTGQEQDVKVGDASDWSGKKEMLPGDLVFLYTMSPVKAFTGVYEVVNVPRADPWGGWDGLWVDLEKVAAVPDGPTFSQMKVDPVLRTWGPVKRHFQGTNVEAIPYAVYNRLLELMPTVADDLQLSPEPLSSIAESGAYASEADFEAKVIEALLRSWGLGFLQQAPCRFQFGVNEHCGRIDFVVRDSRGVITIIESKLRIVTDDELNAAIAQAKSYALMQGTASFVVAAPEGFWCYSLDRNRETLLKRFTHQEVSADSSALRHLILSKR